MIGVLLSRGPLTIPDLLSDTHVGLTELLRAIHALQHFHLIGHVDSHLHRHAWIKPGPHPVLGWNVSTVGLGVNHQSNGRGGDTSRSWNRVYGQVGLEKGDWVLLDLYGTNHDPRMWGTRKCSGRIGSAGGTVASSTSSPRARSRR